MERLCASISTALLLPLLLLACGGGGGGGASSDGDGEAASSEECFVTLPVADRGAWAPLRVELTDERLYRLGLPPRQVLRSRRYPEPTRVTREGQFEPVTAFAGAGWFGIRPGGWLLLLDGGVGWCSLGHVYGSPGSYQISTAGHCGQAGDTATVIAAVSDDGAPILLDFGKFSASVDEGLGNDWALISIDPEWQDLVSPTVPVWGGPRGTYTRTGSVAAVTPSIGITPDPLLAQIVVHYGHGAAVGAGGTPRAGAAIHWGRDHFMFSGAISIGDSGAAANTLAGDAPGATMQAAGIITHIYIDPLMCQGIGIMGGTRATKIPATLANGQIVPYPVPAPGLP